MTDGLNDLKNQMFKDGSNSEENGSYWGYILWKWNKNKV